MYCLDEHITREVKKDNCFDFLRYLFAYLLIVSHFCVLTGHTEGVFLAGDICVKAFFFMSGFLVTYSFIRREGDWKSYAVRRFVRIVPAYAFTVLCCIIAGCCVTSLSVSEYITSPHTLKYAFCNLLMLNWLEPSLPGVFESNGMSAVNGSLWGMKFETLFYVCIPVLILIVGRIGKKSVLLPLLLLGMALHTWLPVQLRQSCSLFAGMFLLLFYDTFCKHKHLFFALSLASEAVRYTTDMPLLLSVTSSLEPLCFSVALLYVAYNASILNFFRRFENITYGLFLFHFPVIQILIHTGLADYSLPLCFAATVILSTLLAYITRILVEHPVINRFS